MAEFKLTSTRERYEELKKSPLFFCKYTSEIIFQNGNYTTIVYAMSCDPTLSFIDARPLQRGMDFEYKLLVVGDEILPNEGDDDDNDEDKVKFKVRDFVSNPNDWKLAFNDAIHNYKIGDGKYFYLCLLWVLDNYEITSPNIRPLLCNYNTDAFNIITSALTCCLPYLSSYRQNAIINIYNSIPQHSVKMELMVNNGVEDALRLLWPTDNFSNYGLFQKVNKILSDGVMPDIDLWDTSNARYNNIFLQYINWRNNSSIGLHDYNILSDIIPFLNAEDGLTLVKRYLHDIRTGKTVYNQELLCTFRDNKFPSVEDTRQFLENPGAEKCLVVPLFCDCLLKLVESKGDRLQDFNGILDMAVSKSFCAHPNINLGLERILPYCDGGLRHCANFAGFMNYSVIYKFDEERLTNERLLQTAKFLISRYAEKPKQYICTQERKVLTKDEAAKCTWKMREQIGDRYFVRLQCCTNCRLEDKPDVWKIVPSNIDVLRMCIDNVENVTGEFTMDIVSLDTLKKSIEQKASNISQIEYVDGVMPKAYYDVDWAKHILDMYYVPIQIVIRPNKTCFLSDKYDLLGVWNYGLIGIRDQQTLAQESEGPVLYAKLMQLLRKLLPSAEVVDDKVIVDYDEETLSGIKESLYYRYSAKDDGYYKERMFLDKLGNRYPACCTPKPANIEEPVTGLSYFWCRGKECFRNSLTSQTLEKEDDWSSYTLYHAAEILGYKLLETSKAGNYPKECIRNFAAEVRQAEMAYSRLICRACGHIIFSVSGSILNGSRNYACRNAECVNYNVKIYLSRCNHCKKGLIDSRDSNKCENGWVICPKCLACCNDTLLDIIYENHRRNGRIPRHIEVTHGKGHNNKNIFFCPQCGGQLGKYRMIVPRISREGVNNTETTEIWGCQACGKNYLGQLKVFEDS